MVVGLGVTTLCLFWVSGPLINPSHNIVYHWNGPMRNLFLAALLDFVLFWMLQAILLFIVQHDRRVQLYWWVTLVVLLPAVVVKDIAYASGLTLPYWFNRSFLGVLLLMLLLLLMFGRGVLSGWFVVVRPWIAMALGWIAFAGLVMLVQLCWFWHEARGLGQDAIHRAVETRVGEARPRVIWILLDELSYQQVYGDRLEGLKLPAFDRLAAQSTVFTHVVPAGISTEVVMPSLISGEAMDHIRSTASGQLLTHGHGWKSFEAHDTVFGDALRDGYRNGVVGWYNPYCWILAGVLDSCVWNFTSPMPNHMSARNSLIANMMAPFRNTDIEGAQRHLDDYTDIVAAGDAMLQDKSLNFVLLHMPIPHPDGIYDRKTGHLEARGDYIDNLALADRYLAHVRAMLERSGQWDGSTVVIMGDHSWRTRLLWQNSSGWTPEEQRASHGGTFDDRPAYIVKLPHEENGAEIAGAFSALKTRAMFDELLKEEIRTPQQLAAWAK